MEKNRFVWIDGMTVCSLTTTCNAKEQKMQRRLSLHLASSKIKRSANALLAKKMLMGLPLVTLFGHFETAPC